MLGGDAVGICYCAFTKRAAHLNLAFPPPQVGPDRIERGCQQNFAGAFVESLGAAPAHPLEGEPAVAGLVFGNSEDQRIDVAAEFHQTDPRLGECTVASRQPRHHSPCRSNLALPQQHVGSPQMILFA